MRGYCRRNHFGLKFASLKEPATEPVLEMESKCPAFCTKTEKDIYDTVCSLVPMMQLQREMLCSRFGIQQFALR
eukprot:5504734-Amphidinium_carterae.1